MKTFFVWFTLFVIICLIIGSFDVPKLEVLSKRGIKTKGKVLDVFPNNHQTVKYSFEAEGKIFTNTGLPGFGNPAPGDLRPGDEVLVFYDPFEPINSNLGDPKKQLKNEVMFAFLAGILGSSFSVFVLKRNGVL
jgi:hypothetical protein